MANSFLVPSRRRFMGGFAAASLSAGLRPLGAAEPVPSLRIDARPAAILLHPGKIPIEIWELDSPATPLRLKPGRIAVIFRNGLPEPAVLDWRGLDGAAMAEPWTAQPPVAPGAETSFELPLRPGTFFAELRSAEGHIVRPARPLPLIVEEAEPPMADRDEIVLIEQWPPAAGASDPVLYTVGGRVLPDFPARSAERLRLRLINASQQQVIAVKIEGLEVRVIALDSAPAEPFLARNSAVVLAPGARADILVDTALAPGSAAPILLHDGHEARAIARLVVSGETPLRAAPLPPAPALPADGLPSGVDLRSALRVDLALQGSEWATTAAFSAALAAAFKVGAGRPVVLALRNRGEVATSFHLHGHHFRLLDRLDDGWKPFWLDTLVVEPGQTERIAFAASYAGRWLIEATATRPGAPRLLRWYSVG